MSAFQRSNMLIEHAFGAQAILVGATWRTRKGGRRVVVDQVGGGMIHVHNATTGRRTTIRRDLFVARYVHESTP